MKKKAVLLEMEEVKKFAQNSIFASDIWEIEFFIETGIASIEEEDVLQTACHFLLYSVNAEAISNLLRHFSPKQLPTSLLEYLFHRFDKKDYSLVDQIGRLCSMDKKHPHYPRFVKLMKEVILWKHSHNYLYSREKETWRLNHFETILELVVDHGINIWNFGYLFSEEELGILRLMLNDAHATNALAVKAKRLNYKLENHGYAENLKVLMKMRKTELVHLCKKYGIKGYSKLRSIHIIHLLLSTIPSKETDGKPKPWTTYWIEDFDFMTNLHNFNKMKLGQIRAIGYKYGIKGAFYLTKDRLIRELLRIGKPSDHEGENLVWQDYWLEENYPEVNLFNLQEMKRKDLVKIAYKYGLKNISRLRKDEIIQQILNCDPRMVSISKLKLDQVPEWWIQMNQKQ